MLFELLSKRYPGMRQWLSQRISAIVLASYSMLLVVLLLVQQPSTYTEWQAFFAPIWWRAFTLLFFINLLLHAWLGVGNVLKDYIFNQRLRVIMQFFVEVLAVVEIVWMANILWQV